MSFRYTSPPLTQGLGSGLILVACMGLFAWPAFQEAWAGWVEGGSPWLTVVGALVALHALVFWGMAAAFGYVDQHDSPSWIARYRIQSGPRRQPTKAKVARVLALNQLLISPLMVVLLWLGLRALGWEASPTLPSPLALLLSMAFLSVASALWFYATHRFLHRPWWMKRVHRVHHEFRTSTCLAAEYAHPVEAIFGNFGTLAVGILLLRPDLATLYVYTVLSTLTFVGHHSGYAVPWLSWSVHHDWHHYRYKEVFGTFGVLDRLLGTDKELRELEDGQEV